MKKIKGAWYVGNTITIENEGKKFDRKVLKDKAHGEHVKVGGKFVTKEELMPKKDKKAVKETPKKESSKKTEKKAEPKRQPSVMKKLEKMQGGDRIAIKGQHDEWYMKIPSGVYEGRFEVHTTQEVVTAERLVKLLDGAEVVITKRKTLLLESFRDDVNDDDTYTIPKKWMAECWVDVMKKLEQKEDKDGYKYYLYAEGDEYILTLLSLEFE